MIAPLPQHRTVMRKRFPDALRYRYGIADVPDNRPGLKRAHVFDFAEGMRLIVSVDVHPHVGQDRSALHVSASINVDTSLWVAVTGRHMSPGEFIVRAKTDFRSICTLEFPALQLVGLSRGKCIPHFYAEIPTSWGIA